ncbi:MAG: glycosyltransferase, partial [Acidobacteriota bacterium]
VYQQIRALADRDPRFSLRRAPERLGFYLNFEHCLSLVPPAAQYVALCDHDDFWHADKLQALLAAFDAETTLAYSDMNIVDDRGNRIHNTYWTTRRNNYTDLPSLFIANTITGAASLFRSSALPLILPFPRTPGDPYHDHWIACLSLAMGKIAYVNRPLYDYVQHDRNVIGHFLPENWVLLKNLRNLLTRRDGLNRALDFWRRIYFGEIVRIQMLAQIIELRAADRLKPAARRPLSRIAQLDQSLPTLFWLPLRRLRELHYGNQTLGAETRLLRGILWKHFASLGWNTRVMQPPEEIAAPLSRGNRQLPDSVMLILNKIAPLELAVSDSTPVRVNLLIPIIDFRYMFAGYIAKFHLAKRLAQAGFRVRIVILDHCEYTPSVWREKFERFDGLSDVLECCDLFNAFNRSKPLHVNPADSFIATTWWTAHIAHRALKHLDRREFLYLIQEFEPFTFPMGSLASLSRQTYDWPHNALFSTTFLQDYFRQQKIGVFANGPSEGEIRSTSFQNAITKIAPLSASELRARTTRRLLFYARPESHASRNMFEIGILA